MSTHNYKVGPRKGDFDPTLKRKEKEKREKNRDKRSRADRGGSKGDDGISVSVSDSRRVLWRAKKEESEAERSTRRRTVLSLTLWRRPVSASALDREPRDFCSLSFFLTASFFFFLSLFHPPSLSLTLSLSLSFRLLQMDDCKDVKIDVDLLLRRTARVVIFP